MLFFYSFFWRKWGDVWKYVRIEVEVLKVGGLLKCFALVCRSKSIYIVERLEGEDGDIGIWVFLELGNEVYLLFWDSEMISEVSSGVGLVWWLFCEVGKWGGMCIVGWGWKKI